MMDPSMMAPGGAPPPMADPSAVTLPGQQRAMGAVDPMQVIAYIMQLMGPGATPEAARALLAQIGSGELQGPASGLEASMPPAGAMGPMGPPPGAGMDPAMAAGMMGGGPPPGQPPSNPMFPDFAAETLG